VISTLLGSAVVSGSSALLQAKELPRMKGSSNQRECLNHEKKHVV
jgi:hypothetical protein